MSDERSRLHSVSRRTVLGTAAAAGVGAHVALAGPGAAAGSPSRHWTTAWYAAPADFPDPTQAGVATVGRTVRLRLQPHAGGDQLTLRFSNAFGVSALRLGPVMVGAAAAGAAVVPGSRRPVTFRGSPTVVIPPGAEVVSDRVAHRTAAFRDLLVSVHVPPGVPSPTAHPAAFETSYISGPGDYTRDLCGDAYATRIVSWPFLTGVHVLSRLRTVVCLGDSITDGDQSTPGANRRWPDLLARRLHHAGGRVQMSVANAGISANQVTRDALLVPGGGQSALARLDRDVLSVPGATDVIVHEGTNDLGLSLATASEVVDGLVQIARRARHAGLRVHATTITPAGRAQLPGHSSVIAVRSRNEVNQWLRRSWSRHFDGFTDLARVMADPSDPDALAARFDSGDGLHPNDAGYRAIAHAFRLRDLSGSPAR